MDTLSPKKLCKILIFLITTVRLNGEWDKFNKVSSVELPETHLYGACD